MKRYGFLVLGLTLLLALPGVALAQMAGMPDATGSPINQTTCKSCHSGAAPPILLINGLPDEYYEPGVTYTLNLSVTGGPFFAFGFCIETLDDFDLEAGVATITDPTTTQKKSGSETQVYHTINGIGSYQWSYDWTAPAAGVGSVIFYMSGLSGNNSGTPEGDGAAGTVLKLDEFGAVMTETQTPTMTVSPLTATETPGITSTMTMTPYLTATPTQPPATATPTMTETEMVTPTPAEIQLDLEMPANVFSEGDTCYLHALIMNPGSEQVVDLYVLLAFGGEFWSYPTWGHISTGLGFETMTVTAGMDEAKEIIPSFTMPMVPPSGPFWFYAAMFETGYLDLDYLVSTGGAWNFSLQ
jgi:hypothetical protein